MSSVEGVLTAAADVQHRLDEMGLEFCFIGGLAVARWGEPRYTQDVDLTVLCPFGDEEHRARELVSVLSPRV